LEDKMPDFRKTLDESAYKPAYTPQNTTGPDGPDPDGDPDVYRNNPQLDQSSAQKLAELLGATLVPVTYSGGPYAQDKPQYQLDFGSGDLQDASMVYSNYQRNPSSFNQQMQDEYKTSSSPSVAAAEFAAGKLSPPAGHAPVNPGAGGGGNNPNAPGPTWPNSPPPNIPGPKWPDAPPANKPGPIWTLPPLPGQPTNPAVVPVPGTGVQTPGGFTPPPLFSGQFPMPIDLNDPDGSKRRAAGLLGTSQGRGGGLLQ
jgi:hypothetical protein